MCYSDLLPVYKVNLDDPPSKRWEQLMNDRGPQVSLPFPHSFPIPSLPSFLPLHSVKYSENSSSFSFKHLAHNYNLTSILFLIDILKNYCNLAFQQ